VLLAMMARSQANYPKAQNLRPLIGQLTSLVIPELPA
jgi:beta-lactamase class A